MALQTTWFIFITVLWTGFFILEGFDFGVGMLVPLLGRDDPERQVLRATIGPVWDGNEVWLLVAGGATFAAFPDWYATMFSAYYLPLFLVLVALILRACASEYRNKAQTARGRAAWDWLMAGACLLAPLLVGVAFGGLLGGIPINGDKDFTGSFVDLVQPYALVSGLTFACLCLFQGLAFLRLKTTDDLEERATALNRKVGAVAVALLVVFLTWTQVVVGGVIIPNAGQWLALTFAVSAAFLTTYDAHRGWGFLCTSAAIGFTVMGFFGTLYPNLMVSSTSASDNITIANSSGSYTLTLITIITLVMLPIVMLYQAWTYKVFRGRISTADVAPPPSASSADAAESTEPSSG